MNPFASRREIELEGRLNAISSKAVRTPEAPEAPEIQMSREYGLDAADLDMRETQIEAQLAKISKNAIEDKLGFKPSKIKSAVTKDMIFEYQQEMQKPIEINGRKYRYHPSSVDIDIIQYVPPNKILSSTEIRALEGRIERITNANTEIEKSILKLASDDAQLNRDYDSERGILSRMSILVEPERERNLTRIDLQFNQFKQEIELKRQRFLQEILDNEMVITRMQEIIESNARKQSENQAEKTRVDRENKARLKAYEEDLKLLNRGRMDIRQEADESDEEYRQRLIQTGQMTDNEDEMQRAAALFNRDKLKTNMLELLRDTAKISNVLAFMADDEVFSANQLFGGIKKMFLETFGFNNTSVSERAIYEFIDKIISPVNDAVEKGLRERVGTRLTGEETKIELGEEPPPGYPLSPLQQLAKLKVPELKDYYRARSTKKAIGSRTKQEILKFIQDENLFAPPPEEPVAEALPPPVFGEPVPMSRDDVVGVLMRELPDFKKIIRQRIDDFEESAARGNRIARNEIQTNQDILGILNAMKESDPIDKIYQSLDELNAFAPQFVSIRLGEIYPRVITGLGLKPIKHDIPNLIEFGRVMISPRKLYYKNTLAIKHKSGNSLAGLPNVQVSDQFVSIIMNLLRGQKPTLRDFSALDLQEKGIYDSLIYTAGLQKETDNTFKETKKQLKDRLELVEGEIGAGNTNPLLKKEMLHLLGKMAHTGMIGYGDAKRYFKAVCSP